MHFLTLFAAATSVSAISASLLNLKSFEKVIDALPMPSALTEEEITKAEQVFNKFSLMTIKERVAVLNSFGENNLASGGVIGGVGGVVAGGLTGGLVGGAIGHHIGRKNAEKNA